MWCKSIGLMILVILMFVFTIEDNETADLGSSNRIVHKDFELVLTEATWYQANNVCKEDGMVLASITSRRQHQYLERLVKDKYNYDAHFWISKSALAKEGSLNLSNISPNFSKSKPNNQCGFYYWLDVELCVALRPLANEWNYDRCNERKFFICERSPQRKKTSLWGNTPKKESVIVVKDELNKLVDKVMFSEFAEVFQTATEDKWFNLVKGGLQMWLEEQRRTFKPKSFLIEMANQVAAKLTANVPQNDEIKTLLDEKFNNLSHDERVALLSDRFRQWIGDEYVRLEGIEVKKSRKPPSDLIVDLLVGMVMRLVSAEADKLAPEKIDKSAEVDRRDTIDEKVMKDTAQNLLQLSENEFQSYLAEIVNHYEEWGIAEFDMNILVQLYYLVKQELFTTASISASRATFKELIDVVEDGVYKIIEGRVLNPTAEMPVFGQLYIALALGIAVLTEEQVVKLDDRILRDFVKSEIKGLLIKDKIDFTDDGYMRFVVDEFVKLSSGSNLLKNEAGQLVLENIVDVIASQLFWFVADEVKLIIDRVAELRIKESNEILDELTEKEVIADDKLPKLLELVEQELFVIAAEALLEFNEEEVYNFVKIQLSKLLAGDTFKMINDKSVLWKDLIKEELSIWMEVELGSVNENELIKLVRQKYESITYESLVEVYLDVSVRMVANEFMKLIEKGALNLTVQEGNHQFGTMVHLVVESLLEIAGSRRGNR